MASFIAVHIAQANMASIGWKIGLKKPRDKKSGWAIVQPDLIHNGGQGMARRSRG
jgi:hypothetical protein